MKLRVGSYAVFTYRSWGISEDYLKHSRQLVRIVADHRKDTHYVTDFRVQAGDGWEGHVYAPELTSPPTPAGWKK